MAPGILFFTVSGHSLICAHKHTFKKVKLCLFLFGEKWIHGQITVQDTKGSRYAAGPRARRKISGTICVFFVKGKNLTHEQVSLPEGSKHAQAKWKRTEKIKTLTSPYREQQNNTTAIFFSNARPGSVSIIRKWLFQYYVCKCAAGTTWLWSSACDISNSSVQRSHTKHYRQVCSGRQWLEESYRMSARLCDTLRLLVAEKKSCYNNYALHIINALMTLLQRPSQVMCIPSLVIF